MFGARWPLFRLRGIQVSADPSWLFVVALLTLSLAGLLPAYIHELYPDLATGYSPVVYWLSALLTAAAFFACIVLHELGHAVVAQKQGMSIRGITLFLFGGVAEIGDEPKSAGDEIRMALAGPAVSFVLAILFGLAGSLGQRWGLEPLLVVACLHLMTINALVLVFNLIPAFPLDGGRVLRGIIWGATGSLRRATYWASLAGRAFSWFLIGWGLIRFLAGDWLGGIWIALIGLFVGGAARQSYLQVLVRQALAGESVRRFMTSHPHVAPPGITLLEWVEDYVYRYHRKGFPVATDGRLEGFIDTKMLDGIPRSEWGSRTVRDVMRRDVGDLVISADADAHDALRRMQRSEATRLPVVDDGRVVGVISLKDLLQYFSLKAELEGTDKASLPPTGARRSWSPAREPFHEEPTTK